MTRDIGNIDRPWKSHYSLGKEGRKGLSVHVCVYVFFPSKRDDGRTRDSHPAENKKKRPVMATAAATRRGMPRIFTKIHALVLQTVQTSCFLQWLFLIKKYVFWGSPKEFWSKNGTKNSSKRMQTSKLSIALAQKAARQQNKNNHRRKVRETQFAALPQKRVCHRCKHLRSHEEFPALSKQCKKCTGI